MTPAVETTPVQTRAFDPVVAVVAALEELHTAVAGEPLFAGWIGQCLTLAHAARTVGEGGELLRRIVGLTLALQAWRDPRSPGAVALAQGIGWFLMMALQNEEN